MGLRLRADPLVRRRADEVVDRLVSPLLQAAGQCRDLWRLLILGVEGSNDHFDRVGAVVEDISSPLHDLFWVEPEPFGNECPHAGMVGVSEGVPLADLHGGAQIRHL